MNNKLYVDLICFFLFLAWSFCRTLSSTNRVSAVIQGLGRIQNGAVLLYCEYLNLGRKRSSRKKKPLKSESYYIYIEDVRTGKNNAVITRNNRQNTKQRKMQNKTQNKAISNPFKAIFSEVNLCFWTNFKDFRQIYENLFMQNKAKLCYRYSNRSGV